MFSFDKTIAITNRTLVEGDYYEQIKRVAAVHPHAFILREKDISDDEYELLAKNVLNITDKANVLCFIHSKFEIAKRLGCRNIHISVNLLDALEPYRRDFDRISVACHSLSDVKLAIDAGATQIILGTIFETDCKKGLKGKGLEFVREICEYTSKHGDIPVYAIGGIKPDNLDAVIDAGARGGCMMSYMMKL